MCVCVCEWVEVGCLSVCLCVRAWDAAIDVRWCALVCVCLCLAVWVCEWICGEEGEAHARGVCVFSCFFLNWSNPKGTFQKIQKVKA